MLVQMTAKLKDALRAKGIESFHPINTGHISDQAMLEPPCSIKWMAIHNNFLLEAFSYAVTGYFSEVSIGRYTSIGEQVQVGRSNHAMTWVSTSPFFYARQRLFDIGHEFKAAEAYHVYRPPIRRHARPTEFRPISIGNDVWIGHGAFILPGVTIGDGAVIGAMSVVTKNVAPYAIVAGNPATVRRTRLPELLIERYLRLAWWRFAPWQLAEVDFSDPARAADQLEQTIPHLSPYLPGRVRISDLPR